MGGLVGIWRCDSRAAQSDELVPMLAAIRHRGPDNTGCWHNERVALGHNRLSTRDLTTAGSQPMITADGNGVIVYDGEVYNSGELRKALENVGVEFKSTGDTEVVLQALHHWGPAEAIPRFNGMFALAYLDLREPALWLARDRIGIKQLVTADIGTDLIFASEAKALIAHPRMKRQVNKPALMQILIEERYAGQASLLDGINPVEPGSYWKVTDKHIKRRQYYHVLEAIDVARIVDAQREDAAIFVSRFEQQLRESVSRHLVGDVTIATTCSGGVDSGLVSAFAREVNPDIIAARQGSW
jgi:asparagine synthase (glutamine-hydrolysing)